MTCILFAWDFKCSHRGKNVKRKSSKCVAPLTRNATPVDHSVDEAFRKSLFCGVCCVQGSAILLYPSQKSMKLPHAPRDLPKSEIWWQPAAFTVTLCSSLMKNGLAELADPKFLQWFTAASLSRQLILTNFGRPLRWKLRPIGTYGSFFLGRRHPEQAHCWLEGGGGH